VEHDVNQLGPIQLTAEAAYLAILLRVKASRDLSGVRKRLVWRNKLSGKDLCFETIRSYFR
jgi:hypothetical protein